MNKNIIKVPKGIKFLSEWKEFKSLFPDKPYILDKKIPGCGFTRWVITELEDDAILCSPRRMLIENKWEQHKDTVFAIQGYDLGVDIDLNTEDFTSSVSDGKKDYSHWPTDLSKYITERRSINKPVKILVTYDSSNELIKTLIKFGENVNNYRIIIDEMQSIFIDSRFKPDVELDFIKNLTNYNKVSYVSATPMLEQYLDLLPDFSVYPYYELDWETLDPGRLRKPQLTVRSVQSIYGAIGKVIENYKNKNGGKICWVDENNTFHSKVSTEAMIFVNSVKNIIGIIKKNKLLPSEVNILCAKTEDNQKQIDKELKKFWISEGIKEQRNYTIGRVPLEGEHCKMISLCTRTVYFGADFYSDSARIFIASDASIDSLAVDISLDLPQIMGRLRNIENPWKSEATLYIKTMKKDGIKLDKNEFDEKINRKIKESKELIKMYEESNNNSDNSVKEIRKQILQRGIGYRYNYLSMDPISDEPIINNLVMISERRAFDIQQIDYADRFSIMSTARNAGLSLKDNELNIEIDEFLRVYEKIPDIHGKLKYYCTSKISEEAKNRVLDIELDSTIKELVSVGINRCKELGFNITRIRKELGDLPVYQNDLEEKIYSIFSVGDKVSRLVAKNKLTDLYLSLGLNKTAKSSDLNNWFELKNISLWSGEKRVNGYILGQKKCVQLNSRPI